MKLHSDGGYKTGRDIIFAALLGAEEYGFGTAALMAVGCVMARQCHLNTCPVGVATQDEDLRAKFPGNADHVVNFFTFVANEVREHLAAMGARYLTDIIGRSDLLYKNDAMELPKTSDIDLSALVLPVRGARHFAALFGGRQKRPARRVAFGRHDFAGRARRDFARLGFGVALPDQQHQPHRRRAHRGRNRL